MALIMDTLDQTWYLSQKHKTINLIAFLDYISSMALFNSLMSAPL